MNPMKTWASAVLALTVTGTAHAWGPEGHGLVAFMAEANLQPAAKAEVRRLLAQDKDKPKGLDDIASWADDHRSKNPQTGPFHFVDIPLAAASYDEQRDCHYDKDMRRSPEATCVVARIVENARILSDGSKGDPARLEALKFLVHLVGDIHQPMHAVDNGDRGGNGVGAVYFGQNTNLHAVWDGGIIEKQYGWKLGADYSYDHQAVGRVAQEMNAQITPQQRAAWRLNSTALEDAVAGWANESHALAPLAYVGVPTVTWVGWDLQYQEAFWPVIRTQLQKASVRLAAVLNLAFNAPDACPTAEDSPAFYVGPYVGPEDTLPTVSYTQDFYCAALFRALKYPKGFVGVFGSSAIDGRSSLSDPQLAAANDRLYAGIHEFAKKWTAARGTDYPILTGAGPGLMRAANEGAVEAGGASIGYTTYYDPEHDYHAAFQKRADGKLLVTSGLIFTSDVARETSLLSHSKVIVVAPGGSGTGWELFQALDTLRNKQLSSAPMLLVGESRHWTAFCDWVDDMNARGTLAREKFDAVVRRVDDLKGLDGVVAAVLDPTTGEQAFKSLPTCSGTPKR